MKLPNKFGSVYKLSGNRRNPWAVRKTVGWKQIPEKKKAYPIYEFIGYYPTRAEALRALAAYNDDPYNLRLSTVTFREVYEKWSDVHYEKIKDPTGYKAAFETSSSLWDLRFAEIKLGHLQKVVDESGKNTPTLRLLKSLWGLMYDYAVRHEIVPPDKREMVRFVYISRPGNPNAYNRKPFSKASISLLWGANQSNTYLSTILILIYTGLRIGELLALKKEDVHLYERWFYVKEAKTAAGVREVPIAEKLVPLFEHWLNQNSDYLICTPGGRPFAYDNYYHHYWIPLMVDLNLGKLKDAKHVGHRPHDTRHTCVSLLTEAGVDAPGAERPGRDV